MVYPGKPSTGCGNCKKRKIKCDEGRPVCGQCINTKRLCPGYTDRFDLVLRDQTKILHQKAERASKKGKRDTNSTVADVETAAESLPRPDAGRNACIDGFDGAIPAISRPLAESSVDSAICLFFNHFVLIPRHPDGQRGFLECLLPLYNMASHDSLLSLATASVALVISGGVPHNRADFRLSPVVFGKALRKATSAIQDPEESIKDETLMAILLLGFYERITSAVGTSELSGSHDAGALALIKHRGQHNSKSDISTRLSLAVHTQIVESATVLTGRCKTPSIDLVRYGSDLPRNTASRLTRICAQAANLRRFAESAFRNPVTMSTQSATALLRLSRKIDSTMKLWADSVPEHWAYHPASGFDCPADMPRETFVYGDQIDIYSDHTFVSVWNAYRSNRIMILSITLDCLSWLQPRAGVGEEIHMDDATASLQEEPARSLQTIQSLVDDICGSVPYQLGTKLHGGPFDLSTAEYPYLGTAKPSLAHRRAAASLGPWNLLEPLRSAHRAAGLRPGQAEWIDAQLTRIRRIYSVPNRKKWPPPMSNWPRMGAGQCRDLGSGSGPGPGAEFGVAAELGSRCWGEQGRERMG